MDRLKNEEVLTRIGEKTAKLGTIRKKLTGLEIIWEESIDDKCNGKNNKWKEREEKEMVPVASW